jgi:hypothetical protein
MTHNEQKKQELIIKLNVQNLSNKTVKSTAYNTPNVDGKLKVGRKVLPSENFLQKHLAR